MNTSILVVLNMIKYNTTDPVPKRRINLLLH